MREFERLSRKQQRFIPILLRAASITAAAEQAGISQATIYRWLNNATFQGEYKRLRHQFVDQSLHRLQCLTESAVTVLDDTLGTLSTARPATRLMAAKLVLEAVIKNVETERLDERVLELEKRLEFYEKNNGTRRQFGAINPGAAVNGNYHG